jgi:sulfotransferase
MITFLSGLPRTGSTLLSAILAQNPEIHAEGNSAVCQLMWDTQECCERSEQLAANRRQATQDDLVRAIPAIYYKDANRTHIVDKCRSWTLPANMAMIRRYITDEPKVIVMTRPINEIVASFVRLREANGWDQPDAGLLEPMTEPIMRSQFGVDYARATNQGEFHFVEYSELVNSPTDTITGIYDFMGWEVFAHDFDNVANLHPEDDTVYGLIGQHDIRKKVGI